MKKPGLAAAVRGTLALLVGWSFTVVYCTLIVLFSLLTWRRWAREMVPIAARFWSQVMLGLCGIRVVADNPSTLTGRKARIVVSNHPSTVDIMWAPLFLPAGGTPVGKRQMIYMPGINVAWWALKFALLDRARPGRAHQTLAELAETANREQLTVMMLPEGTRSPDGTIRPFKKGSFHLAMKAKLPIYPLVASGAYALWPSHRLYPYSGTMRVRFLEPVDTSDWRAEDLDSHIEALRQKMIDTLAEMDAAAATTV